MAKTREEVINKLKEYFDDDATKEEAEEVIEEKEIRP